MRLYDREFVRGLRKRVRAAVGSDPRLREEMRSHRAKIWTRTREATGLRWMVPLAFAAVVASFPPDNTLWLILAVWGVYLSSSIAAQFQRFCWNGTQAFLSTPMSVNQFFNEGARRCLRKSLWLLVDALVAMGSFYWFASSPDWTAWGILPAAAAMWASALATGTILIARWPRISYHSVATYSLTIGAFVLAAVMPTSSNLGSHLAPAIHQFVKWWTPSGWASQIAKWLLESPTDFPWLPAGLLTGCVIFAVISYRSYRKSFAFVEAKAPRPRASETNEDEGTLAPSDTPATSRVSKAEELVLCGQFLKPMTDGTRRSGWIEQFIFARLRRQGRLLDFLLSGQPGWSRMYPLGWGVLIIGFPIAWLVNQWNADLLSVTLGLVTLIAVSCTSPIFGGNWPGMRVGFLGGRRVAILALLPVGLLETNRIILAVNTLRYFLAIPCWLTAFLAIGFFKNWTPFESVVLGAELWLISLLLQPFFVVFKSSPGTNDTNCGCLMVLIFLIVGLMPVMATGAVLVTMFQPASPLSQGVAMLVLAMMSLLFVRFYRWLYTKRLDLLVKVS